MLRDRPNPRTAARLAALAVVLGLLGTIPAPAPVAAADEPPVILLTGFQPFGPSRPPNPSWEGIKGLDGRGWKGFKLVARELPVVWGEPMKKLEALVKELKPAAVFSFGQGIPGGFTIEALGRNDRAPIPDNDGDQPPSPTIVADGPPEYGATIDAEPLVKALAAKGHPIRVSKDAGRYLCEEALYSLEHLKKTGAIRGPVLFSHVPPLGRTAPGPIVDAARVEGYVLDLLEAWRSQQPADALPRIDAAVKPAAATRAQAADDAEGPREKEKDVRAFVEHYFKVWSDQDMNGYDDCFMTDASIQHIDDQGQLFTVPRPRFVASQREAHRRSPSRMTEVPESIEIRFEQKLARAVVYWKLTAAGRVQKGYDHFTLKQDRGRWRIVNLLFYATSDE